MSRVGRIREDGRSCDRPDRSLQK
uniref:Uncharacterized protein n=1 Tax=Anguilla anguilla TaxID=7936 RepID=A0A0E9QGI1_ANGAN